MQGLLSTCVVAFVLLFAATCVLADTPAHCPRSTVVGVWKFSLGPNNNPKETNCNGTSFPTLRTEVFRLDAPATAVDLQKRNKKGFWTMIYDEGFEIVMGNRKYFAYLKYVPNSNGTYTSICSEIFEGWYHDLNNKNWGCFRGKRIDTKETKRQKLQRLLSKNGKKLSNLMRIAAQKKKKPRDLFSPYGNDMRLINAVNKQKSSWTAQPYAMFDTLSVDDVIGMSGLRHSQRPPRPLPTETLEEDVLDKYFYSLPRNFDWRNVNGVNYISPVRNQNSCGSCYAFAALAVLEARIRIATNNTDQVVLSPQIVTSCSMFSQGCHGGFPYLVGKYAHEFGLVTEECMPYKGAGVSCSSKCKDKSQVRKAANYRYVGGFYGLGAPTEKLMMREIYERGPIAVAFFIPPDFYFYKKGIYRHLKNVTINEADVKIPEWEKTSHAVLCLGWGETEEGEKYWILKNSWGKDWGEDGFFRVARGVDEVAIESEPVAIDPVI